MRQYARGEGMTYKLEHLVCTTRFCEYWGEWCEFLGYNTEIMDWLCEKYDQAALNLNTDGRCLRLKQCRADHPGASYQRRVV